nr:ribonuclease H-like domain-containing protein [Tanacetum cinerariifolium]
MARQVAIHHQEIEGQCIRAKNLEHEHGTLVRKIQDVSDAQVDDGIAIGELRPMVTTLEGRVEVLASQHDGVMDKVVEVEEKFLKMQDKVNKYPCGQVDGLREDVDELFSIMDAPLSPDHVFDFLANEPEHERVAMNGWMSRWETQKWLMALVTPSRAIGSPPSTYEVSGPSTVALEAPFPVGQPLLVMARQVAIHHREIEGLCIRAKNLEHEHGTLVRKIQDVSDAKVDDDIAIGELRPMVTTLEGRVEVLASQHDGVMDKVVEVEEKFLKMQDKVNNYPCGQVDGLREDVDELFSLRQQNGNGLVSVIIDTHGMIEVLPPKTAEEMWEAIKSRFGGNDESKKMQKYLLKQQFKGFSVSTSEGLHKGYDRFQSLLSQLEIHGAGVSHEDVNEKFLSTIDVSVAYSVSSLSVSKSQKEGSSSYTDEVIHSFFANQSSAPQLDYDDLEQINDNDMEDGFNGRAKENQDSRRRDAGYNGNKTRDNGRRPEYQDDSKALVAIDGEDIDWSGHVEEDAQNYAMM